MTSENLKGDATSLTGSKVLVTGAGGFIGSHLTERLVALGCETRALVHYNALGSRGWLDKSPVAGDIDVVAGDLADAGSVLNAAANREIIFHLGALIAIPYSYIAPISYARTNFEGTLNVLNAARAVGAKVIHTSTSEVYGSAITVPISEDHPLQGQSPYSATKIGADKLVEAYHASFELPVLTVRPFNTFGPRQSARAVIPTIITQCATRDFVHLGALSPTRDLNFVRNTVEGFVAAATAEAAVGETINLGTGREISIGDLASLIAELMGKSIEIRSDEKRLRPQNSEVFRLLADTAKARRLLGWRAEISLEDGLRETIDWVCGNLDAFSVGEYTI
jgi:NAD dependent epimerase/dehydratase